MRGLERRASETQPDDRRLSLGQTALTLGRILAPTLISDYRALQRCEWGPSLAFALETLGIVCMALSALSHAPAITYVLPALLYVTGRGFDAHSITRRRSPGTLPPKR